MKIKKYNEGGMMSQEVEVKSNDLMDAVKQMQAAIKASKKAPMYYEVKACYESEEEGSED
jgi:hypothetical protein